MLNQLQYIYIYAIEYHLLKMTLCLLCTKLEGFYYEHYDPQKETRMGIYFMNFKNILKEASHKRPHIIAYI